MNTCSVETCDRPLVGRGLCSGHYQRLVKGGDLMLHLPIGQREPTVQREPSRTPSRRKPLPGRWTYLGWRKS